MKKINFTLPEFCFLDGNSHLGDTLKNRTLIQHIRSYTILEAFFPDEMEDLFLNCKTYSFEYINKLGISENHILALHFTLDDEDNLPEIFAQASDWYCNYLTWEDSNIIEDETSKLN